ncbi:hypothetical protein ACFWDI_35695 [Streptomyces sp. NPDC060064]|uniref:hypothetical protein n=1 Tax=Streptomyces sp. NPDC060064 TaxID=3347049 RepID=UPI0036844347
MPPLWISFTSEKSNGDVTLGELEAFVKAALEAGAPPTQPVVIERENPRKTLKWVGVVKPGK